MLKLYVISNVRNRSTKDRKLITLDFTPRICVIVNRKGILSASEVVKTYGGQLLRFVKARVQKTADAEDILQEVWYQFSRVTNIDDLGNAGAWLYSVTRNKITDSYRKKKNEFFSVIKFLLRKYPKLAEALERRHEVYNATIDELHRLEKEGDTFIITPSRDLGISRIESDGKKLQEVYDIGVKDANDHLENIMEFLSESNKNAKIKF